MHYSLSYIFEYRKCQETCLETIAPVSPFFKDSEFYEISCDVSLKPIMHINELKSSVIRPEFFLLSIFSVYDFQNQRSFGNILKLKIKN